MRRGSRACGVGNAAVVVPGQPLVCCSCLLHMPPPGDDRFDRARRFTGGRHGAQCRSECGTDRGKARRGQGLSALCVPSAWMQGTSHTPTHTISPSDELSSTRALLPQGRMTHSLLASRGGRAQVPTRPRIANPYVVGGSDLPCRPRHTRGAAAAASHPPRSEPSLGRYYEFYFSRKSAMDEDEIIRNLAPSLKRAALSHLVHRSVQRIPLFESKRRYSTPHEPCVPSVSPHYRRGHLRLSLA